MTDLTDRDREILDFEQQWWRHQGPKEMEVRARFDLSAVSYYQILAALIDRPEALEYAPMLVLRLRRLRDQQRTERRRRRPYWAD